MKKYRVVLSIILFMLLALIWWWVPQRSMVVPVVLETRVEEIEENTVGDTQWMMKDMATLAMDVGNYEIAKKYIELSGSQDLKKEHDKKMRLRADILEAVQKGLSIKQVSHNKKETIFKRLVSLETIEEEGAKNLDVVSLLLLAQVSVERGFVAWDAIAKQLQALSQQLETSDAALSELLYTMGQRVDYD